MKVFTKVLNIVAILLFLLALVAPLILAAYMLGSDSGVYLWSNLLGVCALTTQSSVTILLHLVCGIVMLFLVGRNKTGAGKDVALLLFMLIGIPVIAGVVGLVVSAVCYIGNEWLYETYIYSSYSDYYYYYTPTVLDVALGILRTWLGGMIFSALLTTTGKTLNYIVCGISAGLHTKKKEIAQ